MVKKVFECLTLHKKGYQTTIINYIERLELMNLIIRNYGTSRGGRAIPFRPA